ncbi:MAG: site-specific DNA-methyltransferase [Sulfurihydrogenibium sp.]|jgi:site-specific DNA-methyltransferase (adenine-specific)|nr:site-specific DNA-methyltransferase [Sulfurihydrogenibium sp.]
MAKWNLVNSLKGRERNFSLFSLKDNVEVLGRVQRKVGDVSIDIFCGSVEEYVKLLDDNSIHLVVTSPPYNCGIKYDVYDDNKDFVEYKKWLTHIFSLLKPKLASGGKVAVNFPKIVRINGRRKILLSAFEEILESAGFEIIDCIVWVKARDEKEAVGVAGRSTGWGSWMSPSAPYVRPISEFVLIAKKEGRRVIKSKGDMTKEEFLTATTSTWFIPSKSDSSHPAVFPPELPERLIKLYTAVEENVLDPFMGVGNTMLACLRTRRNFFGSEISPNYVARALEKLDRFGV